MTEKYCNRDEVNCELGHSEIHDTAYYTYCEDYDDGGKYDD